MSYVLHEDLNVQPLNQHFVLVCPRLANYVPNVVILATLPHVGTYVCLGVLLLLRLFFAFACQPPSPEIRYFTGAGTVPL
jgi:hypothetical protein